MAGDTSYASVALLLHCDGSNGSTTFTDSSPTPKTVTAYGNAQISTARSQFGGASALFDGSGDYLLVGAAADFKHLHDDSTDYTIEGWIYWSGGSSDLTILSTAAATAANAATADASTATTLRHSPAVMSFTSWSA